MNIDRSAVRKKHSRCPVYIWVFRIILIGLSLIFIYPLFFSFLTSLKTLKEFFVNLWGLPQDWLFSNYAAAWVEGRIGEYFMNSVIISGLSVLFIELFATLAAYALARLKLPGVELLLLFFFAIQMLPTETIIIPLYLILSKMHILRITYLPIILGYVGWALPGTIIIMKNFLIPSLANCWKRQGLTEQKKSESYFMLSCR